MIHPMDGLFLGDTVRGRVLIALRKGMHFNFPYSVLHFLHENYANKSNPYLTQSPWLFLTVLSQRTRKTKFWKAIYLFYLFIYFTYVCVEEVGVFEPWKMDSHQRKTESRDWFFLPWGFWGSNSACHIWQQASLLSEMFHWPTSKNFKDSVLQTNSKYMKQ